MCGIAGFITRGDNPAGRALGSMRESLNHRGPDSRGDWVTHCREWTVGLTHTRLAILDLSSAGAQPMRTSDERHCITYNGEVYNFEDIREDLVGAGVNFSSYTDTEVVLAGYGRWGCRVLSKLRGMFAFGLWDNVSRQLVLARDPLGIKPLYYYHTHDVFVFASEVRALLASGIVPRTLDPAGVTSFLSWGSVQAPDTIVRGIRSLPPGCLLTVRPEAGGLHFAEETFAESPRPSGAVRRDEAVHQLRHILRDSVRRHMISDVPVGVFLSGGLDSTAVVALASEVTDRPLKTFTVAFEEKEYCESKHASAVASRFGTDHQELCVTEGSLLNMLPMAVAAMDQPTMDGTNTYVVSKAVRDAGIPVALSGLGGDELFGGYASFRRARRMQIAATIPRPLRRAMAACGRKILNGSVSQRKFWQLLESGATAEDAYAVSRQLFDASEVHKLTAHSPAAQPAEANDPDILNSISRLEMAGYMTNTLLRDTDCMSMSHALETRVPFVDSAVVSYVSSLPGSWKLEPRRPKPLLLDSLGGLIPEAVWNRRKMGFTFPFRKWMTGELRAEIDSELASSERTCAASLDPDVCRSVWTNFQQHPDRVRWSRPWSLYILSRWCRVNRVSP